MDAKEIIKGILGKKYVYLVDRGNSAIKLSLQIAKLKGFESVYIQDQGGWLTYRQFPKKMGFKVIELKTDNGLIIPEDLMGQNNFAMTKKNVLLYQSMTGYCAEQDIQGIRKNFGGLIILDICNLGDKVEFEADIFIGSFGKDKVVNLGYGGFIASDFEVDVKGYEFDVAREDELLEKLYASKKRLKFLYHKNRKVKLDLHGFDVIHRDKKGINVIVKFKNDEGKEEVVSYCDKKGYEWTLCPKYIKVNIPAISIELKRL